MNSRENTFDDILWKEDKYLGLWFGKALLHFFCAELAVLAEVKIDVFKYQLESGFTAFKYLGVKQSKVDKMKITWLNWGVWGFWELRFNACMCWVLLRRNHRILRLWGRLFDWFGCWWLDRRPHRRLLRFFLSFDSWIRSPLISEINNIHFCHWKNHFNGRGGKWWFLKVAKL